MGDTLYSLLALILVFVHLFRKLEIDHFISLPKISEKGWDVPTPYSHLKIIAKYKGSSKFRISHLLLG